MTKKDLNRASEKNTISIDHTMLIPTCSENYKDINSYLIICNIPKNKICSRFLQFTACVHQSVLETTPFVVGTNVSEINRRIDCQCYSQRSSLPNTGRYGVSWHFQRPQVLKIMLNPIVDNIQFFFWKN